MDNSKNNNTTRFLLTFFLGWIGSIIINATDLKPKGYRSRTLAYLFLSAITFGIYGLVASISNLSFDPQKNSNIGYAIDSDYSEYANSTENNIEQTTCKPQTNLPKQPNQTKEILKKVVIVAMALMGILTFTFGLCCEGSYKETGFSFLGFSSQIIARNYDWAIYVIGVLSIILIIISVVLFVLSIISISNNKKPNVIVIYACLGIAIFYNVIGIIFTIIANSTYGDYYSFTTSSFIPMLIQFALFAVYKAVDKLSFSSCTSQTIETQSIKPIRNSEALELLEKFAELKEKGILSEEEFQTKKKEILG